MVVYDDHGNSTEIVEMKWENAKITSTFIGIEDHGIFAWNIDFAGPGWVKAQGLTPFRLP